MMAMVAIHITVGTYACFFLPDRVAMGNLYGLVNNVILLAYYGAPLGAIGKIISTKSASSLFFPTVLINLINGDICRWHWHPIIQAGLISL